MSRNFASEIVSIPIDTICADDRLREIDTDCVDLLSVSMDEYGLLSPLWVREAGADGLHDLIAGAHRLEAAKRLGWVEIIAIVFSVEGLDARMMEIDENLFRRELSPLDRATFLAERKEIYETLHPETKNGAAGLAAMNNQTDKFVSLVPSFAEATAEKLGVDGRTVFRAIARATKIVPDVRKLIATTWVAQKGSVLDALARLAPDDQRAVAALLVKENGPKTVALAQAEINGTSIEPDDEEVQYTSLLKAWRRAGKRARDQFIAFLDDEGALTARLHAAQNEAA